MKNLLLILALFVGNSFADKPLANFYLNCEGDHLGLFGRYGIYKSLAKYDERSDSLLWTEYYDEDHEEKKGKAYWNELFLPYRKTNIDFHIFSDVRDNFIYRQIEIDRKNLSIQGSTWYHECKLIDKTKYQEIYYQYKNRKVVPKSKFKGKNKI